MDLKGNWIAYSTIVRKEVIRFTRIWQQTLLPSAITMTLYMVIFGTFIGSRIDDMRGFPYIQFILPGLIMMAVITNTYSNVVSSFFGSKFQKSIEELLISPTPSHIIILGYITGGILRGLIVGSIVVALSMIFAELQIFNLLIIIVFALLTAILFSLVGLINGIFAKKFDDVAIIPTFVLTPLTYLGGVFYSIALLPPFWQAVSKANPILYMINGFRYGFLGISDVNVAFSLGMLVMFCIAVYFTCHKLIEKGVGLKS